MKTFMPHASTDPSSPLITLPLCAFLLCLAGPIAAAQKNFNVRDYGAVGDGQTLDTAAINQAIDTCAGAGGGRVRLPPGNYLSGTVRLQSRVEFYLEAGATLRATTNLDLYQTFTASKMSPIRLASSRWHRGLILAEDAQDFAIAGPGAIDGRHVFDPRGEERMRGPHGILLGRCRNFTLRDVVLTNAGNYALLFLFTDQVSVSNVTFAGGWDGVHFRGSPERWCHDVRITDCRFFTGDDSIAGSYWDHVVISNCTINSSCNGIRLIGPARDTLIAQCEFFGPGRHEHRTSRAQHRTNMLAALCLQPSAWEPMPGPMDNIRMCDLKIRDVTTPFHIVIRTNNTAGRLQIERVTATGAYRAACSVESWGEPSFDRVVFRDVSVAFTGGGQPEDARLVVRSPGVDARKLPAWGFYVRGVKHLALENVRLTCEQDDARPMFLADGLDDLILDNFQCSRPAAAPDLFALNGVQTLRLINTDLPQLAPRALEIQVVPPGPDGRVVAGQPFAALVKARNPGAAGLGKLDLTYAGQSFRRWAWFRAGETKDVRFDVLRASAAAGELRSGDAIRTVTAE
jgi:hypothetical protein